jgi:hypothetical protein
MDDSRSPIDRRRTTRGGRRAADPKPDPVGERAALAASSLLWQLPDGTRCWMMDHRGHTVVYVNRDRRELRIEIFESEPHARAQSDAWCLEYGASQLGR